MKNILKKIFGILSVSQPKQGYLEYKIQCDNCGEVVNIKVFPERDLNPTYEDGGPAYTLKKEVIK